jgi:hypothetical protein
LKIGGPVGQKRKNEADRRKKRREIDLGKMILLGFKVLPKESKVKEP